MIICYCLQSDFTVMLIDVFVHMQVWNVFRKNFTAFSGYAGLVGNYVERNQVQAAVRLHIHKVVLQWGACLWGIAHC